APPPPRSTHCPYTTLFRSAVVDHEHQVDVRDGPGRAHGGRDPPGLVLGRYDDRDPLLGPRRGGGVVGGGTSAGGGHGPTLTRYRAYVIVRPGDGQRAVISPGRPHIPTARARFHGHGRVTGTPGGADRARDVSAR